MKKKEGIKKSKEKIKKSLRFRLFAAGLIVLVFLVIFRISLYSEEIDSSIEGLATESLNIGKIIFYLIIGILLLMILFVIWMFIIEKNKKYK